ncbi:hypothetical protein JHK82_034165 [Glycine max]|uniref:Uncharacterized protein n=2 Tax=Glycine subgen. Soja TaxID=1462606 RepID=K7LVF3_SOYBN|nr:hypothetical protein JHK87_034094 [Glycine soja]KAG4980919.1 hypothetical protein JHK85_034877 [Glycine max]KAG5119745.1 hypothetical protein JHK82_034165 [Glycine max]KAG5140733.1 hypothetical protein JHK84_034501 [Glycine max]KAH1143571.1 hypothetical protein GYH30_034030 [Glycine max]
MRHDLHSSQRSSLSCLFYCVYSVVLFVLSIVVIAEGSHHQLRLLKIIRSAFVKV